jgi:hypothetical protein
VDLSRLPTGEMGWAAVVSYAASTDDRIERYFLEVKSNVDLNTKSGRAKVAKFILGAANRDSVQAARRFGGHAVMLLGVGGGATPGLPAFEAQDLARDVGKWVGVEGPAWDFERIQTGCEQDVIAIVVDPPTGAVWTCRADGDGLADGDIYVRGDGNTRKATGDEIRAMLARATTTAPIVDVDIDLVGEVVALRVDVDRLVRWIEWRTDDYRQKVGPKKANGPSGTYSNLAGFAALGIDRDARSKAEFLAEVEDWRIGATASPTEGLVSTAGRFLSGVRVRVNNRTKTFLREVRIDIEINGNMIATEWLDPEPEYPIDLFPDSPINWGKKSLYTDIAGIGMLGRAAPTYPRSRHGIVDIERSEPVRLVMMMDDLRPQQEFVSDEDEVVLLMIVDEAPAEAVTGTWRMTAADINDVYQGEFTLPVSYRDWRGPIAKLLGDEDHDPGAELLPGE